jgi:hypothetical protein
MNSGIAHGFGLKPWALPEFLLVIFIKKKFTMILSRYHQVGIKVK